MTTTKTTTTKTKTYDDHHGVQKVCSCGRGRWSKCRHSWYLRWTPKGGKRLQIKIDDYAGAHIELKSDAEALVVEIKSKVKDGTFLAKPPVVAPVAAASDGTTLMTTAQLGELYFAGAKNKRTGKPLKRNERLNWNLLVETTIVRPGNQVTTTIGEIPAATITSFDIEACRAALVTPREVEIVDVKGRACRKIRGGTVACNRIVGRWRAVYSWAVRMGHVEATPFLKGGVSIIEEYGEQTRDRRFEEGEYEKLMSFASGTMKDLIDVALGTACRKGELKSLRWYQVRWATNEIALEAKQTKNGKARILPMFEKVRTILERRRLDPDGEPYGPMMFVFGDVTGGKVRDSKTAWTTMRLKAAGFTGQIRDKQKRTLTVEARQALKAYNLHFHDIRREAASSLIDDGADPRAVQTFLDHANLAQTNTYLRLTQKALHGEVARVEARRAAKLVGIGIEGSDPGKTTNGTAADGDGKLKVG